MYKSQIGMTVHGDLTDDGEMYKNEGNITVFGNLFVNGGSFYNNEGSITVHGFIRVRDDCYKNNLHMGRTMSCGGTRYGNTEIYFDPLA